MAKRIARFIISPEIIIDALRMPRDTVIYDIRRHHSSLGQFEMVVIHEDLPEVKEGEPIPEITPQITRIEWEWDHKND